MPSHISINEQETACVSFALLDSLIGFLINKNVISREEIRGIILNAIQIIEATPKNSNGRMTDFVRSLSFDETGF
jgi:hypothetical protein